MRNCYAALCGALLLAITAAANADTITTEDGDGADSWVRSDQPDASLGIDDEFRMRIRNGFGSDRKPYLRFDLSALSFDPMQTGTAALTLFGFDEDFVNANVVKLYGINDGALGDALGDWDEETITHNNAPNRGDGGFEAGPDTTLLSTLTIATVHDYNKNGDVDAADYTIWRDNLGATGAPGIPGDGSTTGAVVDGDPGYGTPDGVVDEADYAVWFNGAGAAGETPESTRFRYELNDPFVFESTPEFVDFLKADTNDLVSFILTYDVVSGSSISWSTKEDMFADSPTLEVTAAAGVARVPEPATSCLLAIGVAGALLAGRRRMKDWAA